MPSSSPASHIAATPRRWTSGPVLALLAFPCLAATPKPAPAPSPPSIPQHSPRDWASIASQNEVRVLDHPGSFLRYHVHTVDDRRDRLRDVVECDGGRVSRLLMLDGKPLSAAAEADERQRLNDLAHSPDQFSKGSKNEASSKKFARDLIALLPDAMIYTPISDPNPTPSPDPTVAFSFTPNPSWTPPSTASEVLTGLRGRVWVDARSGVATHVEGEVFRPVNFGFGMVARVYPGGRISFDQTDVGHNRWIYTHYDAHVRIRALMLKSINVDTTGDTSDFQLLPGPLPFQQAIELLLR